MTEVYKKLAQAQAEFEAVVFDKVNPHFKSKYASLAAIKDAIEPALHKYGFAIIQPWECLENGDIRLSTALLHESGEKIQLASSIIKNGKTDQQLGCSITYQRRYQISSALFLFAEEDDDGELSEGRISPPNHIKKPKPLEITKPAIELLSREQIEHIKTLTKDRPDIVDGIKALTGKNLVRDIAADKFAGLIHFIEVSLKDDAYIPKKIEATA